MPRRPPSSGTGSRRPAGQSSRDFRRARDARRKRNQRIGVLVGALALAAALIGSRLAFSGGPSPASAQNVDAASGSSTASSVSPSASPTTAPTTTAAPVAAMTMTCPTGGGATTQFGHDISVPAPYKVTITYGDGDTYTNDSAHLGAIFSHTYKKAGTYEVKAVLTDPAGPTTFAGCSYTWGP